MPNQTNTYAATATTDTLADHGFTQVKLTRSPRQKKEKKPIKEEPIPSKKPFEPFSDKEEDSKGTNTMEVKTMSQVTSVKAKKRIQKKKKTVRKYKVQVKAALQAMVKAKAAAQAKENDALTATSSTTASSIPTNQQRTPHHAAKEALFSRNVKRP